MAVDDEAAQLAAAAALPLRERAKHKNWKARVAAFEDIIATSSAGGGAADDEAGPFLKGGKAAPRFQFWRGDGEDGWSRATPSVTESATLESGQGKSAPRSLKVLVACKSLRLPHDAMPNRRRRKQKKTLSSTGHVLASAVGDSNAAAQDKALDALLAWTQAASDRQVER